MKKWSLSLMVVTLLFCIASEGLKSAPEIEKTQTKSDLDMTELLERIVKLEKRVADLEKKQVKNLVPVTLTPHVPKMIPQSVTLLPHKDWKRKQFNGLDYYIVPLNTSENSSTEYTR
ncbi:hypothetical protein [Gimesia aquarii]|uniref:Uncharacterized protein n=1 Tax=Gimesia aquarii TaxID=2527964 RepID=A0A517X1L0_9PLAN|nr:hypothetical protein [Gimesia aquarii]QDU11382.1 hypothetical protein V202x_48030 [Gimesia aquarii]